MTLDAFLVLGCERHLYIRFTAKEFPGILDGQTFIDDRRIISFSTVTIFLFGADRLEFLEQGGCLDGFLEVTLGLEVDGLDGRLGGIGVPALAVSPIVTRGVSEGPWVLLLFVLQRPLGVFARLRVGLVLLVGCGVPSLTLWATVSRGRA